MLLTHTQFAYGLNDCGTYLSHDLLKLLRIGSKYSPNKCVLSTNIVTTNTNQYQPYTYFIMFGVSFLSCFFSSSGKSFGVFSEENAVFDCNYD